MKKMTQKVMLEELRAIDKELNKLYERREELARQAKEMGMYNKVWEKLMDDGESHWSFKKNSLTLSRNHGIMQT